MIKNYYPGHCYSKSYFSILLQNYEKEYHIIQLRIFIFLD